jgi:4,5-dihydroxyphthalate decarboxylase
MEALRGAPGAAGDFDLRFVEVGPLPQVFRRMVRKTEFDIAEMAITTYVAARAHGKPFTALPIFPVREFHHRAIARNSHSDVTGPRDLAGRRVGLNRGYTVTTGVWARDILATQYQVDLDAITWLVLGDEHVQEFRPPSHVHSLTTDASLPAMLAKGELAAVIGLDGSSEAVVPLIEDPRAAALRALAASGYYPINHVVVVRDDVLADHPGLATELCAAFARARDVYVSTLRSSDGAPAGKSEETHLRAMGIIDDPLPYGIEPNRLMLERLLAAAQQQHIVSAPGAVEELFVPSTRALSL